jgi:twitching motility protein PilI
VANKDALKALQDRLADRLKQAQSLPPAQNWLAVDVAGHGFLLPLADAGEIFPQGPVQHVPHCQSWMMGIANLRGHLHVVVDLAGFLGISLPVPAAKAAKDFKLDGHLVAFGNHLQINAALRVDRLLGIRRPGDMHAVAERMDGVNKRPHFVSHAWRSADDRLWHELNLSALAADDVFMKVAA